MIRRSTWILLVLFAVSLAGAWLWQRSEEQKAEQEPTPTARAMLLELDTPQIRDIKIENAQGARLYLRRIGGGSWIMTEPERQNLDSQIMAGKLDQIVLMSALNTLTDPPGAAQIGLEPPAYIITVTDEDGRDHKLEVGAVTPTQSGYYLRMNGVVYVVSNINIDELVGMMANPPIEVPTATSEIPAQDVITGTVTAPAVQLPTSTP